MRKVKASYYKAIQETLRTVNSELSLKEALNSIVKTAAVAMDAPACSVVALDWNRKKLIHVASHGLSKWYLRKGLLDADRSLPEVLEGKPVAIVNAREDHRIQYRDLAAKAGIGSILGVPLAVQGDVVGSIRVYRREQREFSERDVEFLSAIADSCAIALENARLHELVTSDREHIREAHTEARVSRLTSRMARPVSFPHPSEEEFARLLDFYQIEWVYEPHSFPLHWDGDRVTEMFTPDFYLPGPDLYIELTTLKQSLVTEKNRKLRRLKELYPEIKIKLLYKKDYDRLLAKYGHGPLASTKVQGLGRVLKSTVQIQRRVRVLGNKISQDYAGRRPLMVGILRSVFFFMADLTKNISIPLDVDFIAISYYSGAEPRAVHVTKDLVDDIAGRDVVLVAAIVDTGLTLGYLLNHLKSREPASLAVCTLLDKRVRRLVEVPLDYVGFEIPDKFVVGYGLDYQEEYRNLPFIALLETEKTTGQVRVEQE